MTFIHDTFFDEGKVFIVVDDDLIEFLQVIHAVHHDLGRFHIVTVIGKSYGTGKAHIAYFRELFAALPLRQRTDDLDVNDADLLGARLQAAHQSGGIDDGACVWHRGDRRKAARRSCLRA